MKVQAQISSTRVKTVHDDKPSINKGNNKVHFDIFVCFRYTLLAAEFL